MAIVINNTPVDYASMHGDLIFTAYNSVNVSQPGYKYICDVYIGSTLACRLKSFPNPANSNGIFNIGSIIRNYIAQQLAPANGLRSQEFGSGQFFLDVTCKFGEEYGGTLYTNLTIDSTRRYYNHYNGRLLSSQTLLSSFTDLALTNRPYENKVLLSDNFTFLPYFPTTTSAITVVVKSYDLSGTIAATSTTTVTPGAANKIQQLNVSPAGINASFAGVITGATSYYTVKIGATSIYKFTLVCEGRYTPYNVHFLNQFGGFETFIFQKLSRKTFDIEKKDFTQLPYRVDGSGVVTFQSSNVLYDTRTTYASHYNEKLKLSTDILTDLEYQWLRELALSPLVYLQEGSYFVPVSISDTNYEQKKFINDKITALQINLEFGEQYNAQYR